VNEVTVTYTDMGTHWMADFGGWWVGTGATKEKALEQAVKMFERDSAEDFIPMTLVPADEPQQLELFKPLDIPYNTPYTRDSKIVQSGE